MNPDPMEQELQKLHPAKPPAELTSHARGIWSAPAAGANEHDAHETLLAQLRLWRTISAGLGLCTILLLAFLVIRGEARPADESMPILSKPKPGPVEKAARPQLARTAGSTRLVPVDVERTMLRADDEGIFVSQDARPMRRVRLEFLETERLLDVEDSAWVQRSFPREAVLKLPLRID